MGQTALSLTCSIMEKLHTGLGDCPRILLCALEQGTLGGNDELVEKTRKKAASRVARMHAARLTD